MNFEQFEQIIQQKMNEVVKFAEDDLPHIIGVEATEHFKESFDKQAFAGTHLEGGRGAWQEVERRKTDSPWYGFDAASPKHFSLKRTTDKILRDTGELANAFSYRPEKGKVTITNDKPYAAVHNFGGQAKIFGKKPFTMPQRKFMAHSQALTDKINEKAQREINNILKQ
ncbi:MAG: phage virion morphogenesis protein [Candidatus Symbiothrix sp.]|jgi:phage gpG-like protein|nr:phage virion morphogenesis protein [Candidatus Symbiothrix sp.]